MRAYLGNVRTPFHKHDLIKRLLSHLRKKETRGRVVALISHRDAYLITAVHILDEPELSKLFAFLKNDYQYLELHGHLLNLEERLILYREHADQASIIRLNPLFNDDLLAHVINPALIFPASSCEQQSTEEPWIDDALLLSFLAYINENPVAFKLDGSLRKRSESDIRKRIPTLAIKSLGVPRVRLLTLGLFGCDLLGEANGAVFARYEKWKSFCNLESVERKAYLAAGLALRNGGIGRPELHATASFIKGALFAVQEGNTYDVDVIHRLRQVLINPDISKRATQIIVNALFAFGFMSGEGEICIPAALKTPASSAGDESSVVVQSNFELTLKRNAVFADALAVAQMAVLIRHDIYQALELTKESITRAFNFGRTAEEMTDLLLAMSGKKLPPNVSFSINAWEKEHRSVRIFSGTVLIIGPERRHLIEHGKLINEMVIESPAQGVYILNTNRHAEIGKALQECGIEQLPAFAQPELERDDSAAGRLFPPLNARAVTIAPSRSDCPRDGDGAELIKKLTGNLMDLNLDEVSKGVLAERIEKRLVLYPEQLTGPVGTRGEKREARGFDYVGKVRIIEQALTRDAFLLEILTRSKNGDPVRYLAKPIDLEKSGNNLNLQFLVLPDREPKSIRVRAISLVRRIKSSLFVPT